MVTDRKTHWPSCRHSQRSSEPAHKNSSSRRPQRLPPLKQLQRSCGRSKSRSSVKQKQQQLLQAMGRMLVLQQLKRLREVKVTRLLLLVLQEVLMRHMMAR